MRKKLFNKQAPIRFKQFSNKPYALFKCVGREVIVGVLSVATLTHAKADGISTTAPTQEDSLINREVRLDEVSVTGARAPITDAQGAVMVKVLSREEILKSEVSTLNDVLKLVANVDVRQRGGFGLQTDISINGGTFDQIAVLLNGINITNTQTGHNSFALPVSPNDIERIEILDGASARIYGSGAFSGAINIVTRKDKPTEDDQYGQRRRKIYLEAMAGSYGTATLERGYSVKKSHCWAYISSGYDRSDGGIHNSFFEKARGFATLGVTYRYLDISLQMGIAHQRFGANTFYSARFDNQYEKNTNINTSLTFLVRGLPHNINIKAKVYANNFKDHYQLIRYMTGAANGENFHNLTHIGGGADITYDTKLGRSAAGFDLKREYIYSSAYGQLMSENKWREISHSDRMYDHKAERWNTSVFAEHNIILNKVTVSAGLLYNRISYPTVNAQSSMVNVQWAPGVDISYRPTENWKMFLSWNKSMRVPTFTDLFISNAVQQGDVNLKPERNSMVKIGTEYHSPMVNGQSSMVNAQWSIFYSRGTDMIDWVYPTQESTVYRAMNIGRLDNMGYSVDVRLNTSKWHIPTLSTVQMSYAYIHQHHETDAPIYRSLYALEYLRHKFVVGIDQTLWRNLSAHWTARWQQRMNGFHPYWKIDGKLQWTHTSSVNHQPSSINRHPSIVSSIISKLNYKLYLKADNITNHRYIDIAGVPQPGLWIMAGIMAEIP